MCRGCFGVIGPVIEEDSAAIVHAKERAACLDMYLEATLVVAKCRCESGQCGQLRGAFREL